MKDYALDKNGDIVLFNNDIEWKTGAPLTAQTIQHRLGANTGEWFLDKDYGIDFGVILRKKQNIARAARSGRQLLFYVVCKRCGRACADHSVYRCQFAR